MKVLGGMVYKQWVVKHPYKRHVFYDLTALAPVEAAKARYADYLQQTLDLTGLAEAAEDGLEVPDENKVRE
jgi:hypothetical protein